MCGISGYITKNYISYDTSKFYLEHRGPDAYSINKFNFKNYNISLNFFRLSIVDISGGMQPFIHKSEDNKRTVYLICNGEIYNFKRIIEKYNLKTKSDCHVILDLYMLNGIEDAIKELDGEFSFFILDINEDDMNIYFGRDRFGIRPLFYNFDDNGLYFSSELKGIHNKVGVQVQPRKIYHINNMKNENVLTYYYIGEKKTELNNIYKSIRETLVESIRDRIYSERPIGSLLSGGLDSSLISGIAAKILAEKGERLKTFSIGFDTDSPDILYAREVAKHINSIHHEIIIPVEKWIENLKNVIRITETYDITTIRASIGQCLLAKWIKENTDIRVVLNGDGSDEITSGYLYFYNAPNCDESHLENLILLNQIHNYDVLRVDRGISSQGIEARVPFLSHHFVDLYLSIDKSLRNPIKGSETTEGRMEKYLLRKAFENENIIPVEVLWRQKCAFSDGVSNTKKSLFEYIPEFVSTQVTYDEFKVYGTKFPSKEAYWYKKIYDEYYPNTENFVGYWMPKWSNNTIEPSARVLDQCKG